MVFRAAIFFAPSKWPLMHRTKHPLTVISTQPQSLSTACNSHTAHCIPASSDYILHTGLYNAKCRLLTARGIMHTGRCTQSKVQNGATSKWVYPWGCSWAAPNLGLIGLHYKPHTAQGTVHTEQWTMNTKLNVCCIYTPQPIQCTLRNTIHAVHKNYTLHTVHCYMHLKHRTSPGKLLYGQRQQEQRATSTSPVHGLISVIITRRPLLILNSQHCSSS